MKIIKLIRNIYLGVLLTLIAVLGVILVSALCSKESYTKVFGYSLFEVQSYSMYPELSKGDLIVCKELDSGEYAVGMVVTYLRETDTIPTTHRIWNIDEEGKFITRGDANNSYDAVHITSEDIYGEVVLVIPAVGIAIGWLTDGGGYIYVAGILLIIGIGIYLLKSEDLSEIEEVKEGKEETKE